MIWVGVALYLAAVPLTYWLAGRVTVFQMVAGEERVGVSVVWPFTWLAALCAALLIGIAILHERIVGPGDA